MNRPPPATSRLQLVLQEPTLHFFLIAAAVFAVYALSRASSENLLEIDQREIDARVFMQEMARGEALSDEQRQLIANAYVEEQILVREAMAMGLDNDARIHDMLAQKMRHVLSGDVIQPSADELRGFYEANLDRYRSLPSVSVDELVFNSREPLPPAVLEALQRGADSAELLQLEAGNAAPLPNVNHIDLSNIFSREFADEVFAAAVGQWSGPFPSNRGQHWLQISERTEAYLPSLEEINDRVRLDWIAQMEDLRLAEQIDSLWDEYTIIISEGGDEH